MSQGYQKILIANRGEIACRVIRSAQAQGYLTVAVYSEADRNALHVQLADEAVCIGPPAVGESYLKMDTILAAAKRSGADAIHPGYGFLSENASFSEACSQAEITFIGPSGDAIDSMGDKAKAKAIILAADVPCVPGYSGDAQDDVTLKTEINKIGYPVLLKAVAGGGGRGMRVVRKADEVDDAIAMARFEAQNAFGSDVLLVEKLLEHTRHVEIQIIADEHGNCIHLGERDCSVQRRHQKVVEESPCPVMTPELREAMGAAAVKAALAAGYVNAGTVEFLLDDDHQFYFLEMNTRLQVEHPVTEMVTGMDLVAMQLQVAQGQALSVKQADVELNGHAIEVRLYAENPALDFAPQMGTIHRWVSPNGEGVRVDHALKDGAEVTPFYDAMIAKVIAWGATREESRTRLVAALQRMTILGVTTNNAFLQEVLGHDVFSLGEARTDFIETSGVLAFENTQPTLEQLLIASAIFIERDASGISPLLKGWHSTGKVEIPIKLAWEDEVFELNVEFNNNRYSISREDEAVEIQVDSIYDGSVQLHDEGHNTSINFALQDLSLFIAFDSEVIHLRDITYAPLVNEEEAGNGVLKAPMLGQVVELHVAMGDHVEKDDVLVVLEAMKMVNHIVAPFSGTVESLSVAMGNQVDAAQAVLTLTPDEPE